MIRKIKLHNWKSHGETEYSFTDGTNVIVGNMGAGKSSILQAISFALFGTFSELKGKDLKLSDVVNRTSSDKSASVELEIEAGKKILEIKRLIDAGVTKEAVIRAENGAIVAGMNPAQVNAYLKDMLKLDEDVFLRTIYAKQNDIDLFLQLRPVERKTRIDELMSIDKFETARKSCVALINRLGDKKEAQEEFIKDFDIENVEKEISELENDCEQLQKERESTQAKIAEVEAEKAELDSKVKVLRKNIEDFKMLEERKKNLEHQLNELKSKLGSTDIDEDLQSVNFRLREIKTKIVEIQRSKSNLKEDLEKHQKNALEIEKKLGMLEHKSAKLADALTEIEKLRADLNELEKEGYLLSLKEKSGGVEEHLRKILDEKSQSIGEISVLKKALAELEATGSTCPVCSAELTSEKKAELVLQRTGKISELDGKVQSLQSNADDVKKNLENIRTAFEKQKDITQRIDRIEELLREERETAIQLSEAKGKKETFADIITQMQQRLDDFDLEIQNFDAELTQLTEKRHLCELKDNENKINSELENVNRELATKTFVPGELEDMELKFENSIKLVQEFKSKIDSYAFVAEEKRKRLAEFEEKRAKFFETKGRIQKFQEKREFLEQFKNALLVAQETLRKELILAVNEIMCGLWIQLYPYEKWTSARLDASENDYILQLKERDGDWISVTGFASGGERMLACLVLRLAFAKVLAQNMNMLILDEPTHNLDDKAINTLVDVIQNRLSGFLEQLFIVTHDEKLAEAGDNIIRIK